MNMSKHLSRRTLLRGAGVALALPLLDTMLTRRALAAAAQPKRRMLAICANLGLHAPFLYPTQAGKDWTPSPYMEPLAHLRNDLSLISGVSMPEVDGGHSAEASFLTAAPHPGTSGFRNSISLDQFAVEKLQPDTRFASLTLNTGGGSISWTRGGVQVPAEGVPSKVFAKLFMTGTAKEIDAQVARIRQGRSVLDTVNAKAKTLSRGLGHGDRDKLDEYFTSVRELEQRMVKAEEWSRKPKPAVTMAPPKDITDRADLIGRMRLMLDLIHLSFQTDSTRIVTLSVEGSGLVPPIDGVTEGHHSLSHHGKDPQKLEQLKAVEKAEFVALGEFLTKLKTTKEDDANLLDRTMVYYGSNLGNASSHSNKNMPCVIAGGGFRHGQHIAFDQEKNENLCNLYVSMLQRMGVETDTFGSGKSTIRGLEMARA